LGSASAPCRDAKCLGRGAFHRGFSLSSLFHFFLFITVELAPIFELAFVVAADKTDFGGSGRGGCCGFDAALAAIAM
jgi:hypothetical protein